MSSLDRDAERKTESSPIKTYPEISAVKRRIRIVYVSNLREFILRLHPIRLPAKKTVQCGKRSAIVLSSDDVASSFDSLAIKPFDRFLAPSSFAFCSISLSLTFCSIGVVGARIVSPSALSTSGRKEESQVDNLPLGTDL